MRVVIVMPTGPKDAYAPITDAGHELVFGTAESSRAPRPSDDDLIPLAQNANCLVFNEGSRYAMESLPELTTVVLDKTDIDVLSCHLGGSYSTSR